MHAHFVDRILTKTLCLSCQQLVPLPGSSKYNTSEP